MNEKSIVAGNWKMNKTHEKTKQFIKDIIPLITSPRSSVYLAVPFTSLPAAVEAAKNSNIIIGAQNMHSENEGAFTGEVSGIMLKTLGVEFVILGHSERRHIFNESNQFINKKVLRALKTGLLPIFCIGETQNERENNQTQDVLEKQILQGLENVCKEDLKNLIIAYEPVWAIGTGKTATSEIAENTHKIIRRILEKKFNKDIARETYILYGGSVKPNNVEELTQQDNIDGVLVGGASLDYKGFAEIVNKA